MKKTFYIIPGLRETCRRAPYRNLAAMAKKSGYEVICVRVRWDKPLSEQVFPVEKDAVIFGFSLGGILAWLVAQQYQCRRIILASMTPHYSFTDRKIKKALIDLLGAPFVRDVIKHLKPTHHARTQTVLYGEREEEKADILVPRTGHNLNDRYIQTVRELL